MEIINGTVVKLIYQNTDNWYSVCDVEADTGKLITVVGIMPYISVGEGIKVSGNWISSKDYGQQFKVEEYEKFLPQKKNEILRYLASGAVKGIGAKIAQKIVEVYGEDSFDVIANRPDWLVSIRGISRKKAYEISLDFKEKSDIREILTFCNGTISSNVAVKVHKKWGKNALGIIQQNPYTLCSGDFGIGFKRADEIALGLGFDPSRDERIISGIKYALEVFATRDGHTYVSKDKLCEGVSKLLGVEPENVLRVLVDGTVNDFLHFERNGEEVSLRELFFAESFIAKKLFEINRRAVYLDGANVEMREAVGDENIFIFGLTAKEVDELWEKGYRSIDYYNNSTRIKKAIERLNKGFNGVSFANIANYLIGGFGVVSDPYMCLADFDSYHMTRDRAIKDYADKEKWNRMSIMNISAAGYFAAGFHDRPLQSSDFPCGITGGN